MDKARKKTDKELKKIEQYLEKMFKDAGVELTTKAKKYLQDFARLEQEHMKDVASGAMSQAEFDKWRKNKLLYGRHWTRLIQAVQNTLADKNKIAIDYINGKVPDIFVINYNQIAEVVNSSGILKGYSFELIDKDTVATLVKSNEIMLPPKKNLDVKKDKLWNAKQVNAQILQGILQGESIPDIAERMKNVCNSNEKAAIRNARTMITAAENSGRLAGQKRAVEDGVILKKIWIATYDKRTRDSHEALNSEEVNSDEMFETINGYELEFPGDWRAPGMEVYACRCSLGTRIVGFKRAK